MAAVEALKTTAPKPAKTAQRGKNNSRKGTAPRIRQLATRYPELSKAEIARRVGCSQANVSCVLKTYLGSTTQAELKDFQDSKADVYDSIQHKLLLSIDKSKISKASALQTVTAAAILEDKSRIIRGQATSINVSVLMDVVEALRSRGPVRRL